jgi:hypothetical protein
MFGFFEVHLGVGNDDDYIAHLHSAGSGTIETHGDGSGEHLYAANIITFFRISKFSVEKMLIGTVPPILQHSTF